MRILKSLILGIFFLFCGASINPAQSGQVANVEYSHKLVNQRWGIEVPYYPENAKLVVNMEYLLTVVDRANLMLNGEATSSYASDPVYATKQAVDIIAVGDAVNRLITYKPMFYVTTTGNTSSFEFDISAAGSFSINWGDGTVDNINKTDTTNTTYRHTYDSAGEYTIGIGGKATAYNTSTTTAAISFRDNTNTAGISGSLGAIFGTLPSGTQPRFYQTFYYNSNLTGEIPADLFAGISGAPASYMFESTFYGCSGLTGTIPENLFAGISGTPASYMFSNTFYGCSGLTGSIPENLFAGISGAPASYMFSNTFNGCSGLTGSIPENLFGNISGAPASSMFYRTFEGCSGLTGIGGPLFAGISGAPASSMFYRTFYGCRGLTGTIPENLFGNISGTPAIYMFSSTFYNCSGLTGSIPENLFAGISGAPASSMFYGTFFGCSGLTGTIPENLFAGISGKPASSMFYGTFQNCSGLTGEIPLGLFGNLTNSPKTYMFRSTFDGCSGLTGPSARMPDGTYLYDFFTGATTSHVSGMYSGATGLSDYSSIPNAWK